MNEKHDILSYGGGLQSAATLVLIHQGRLPKPERIVIADVGKEVASTWGNLERYARPLMASAGLEIEVVGQEWATDGMLSQKGDMLMPVFTQDAALPPFCSDKWKRRVIFRYLRSLGYGPKKPIRMWLGISTNEVGRARLSDVGWVEHYYPLLFGVPMSRHACHMLVTQFFGIEKWAKSRCYDCPYQNNEEWAEITTEERQKAISQDRLLRTHDIQRGGSGVFLHKSRVPLEDADLSAPAESVNNLFGEVSGCDSGHCWV